MLIIIIYFIANYLPSVGNTNENTINFDFINDEFRIFNTTPSLLKNTDVTNIDEYIYFNKSTNEIIDRRVELSKLKHNPFMGPTSPKEAIFQTFCNITNYLRNQYIALDYNMYYHALQNPNPCNSKVFARYKFDNIWFQAVFSNEYIVFSLYSDNIKFNETNIKDIYEKYFIISDNIPFNSLFLKYQKNEGFLYLNNENNLLFNRMKFIYHDNNHLIVCFPNGLTSQKSNRGKTDPWF